MQGVFPRNLTYASLMLQGAQDTNKPLPWMSIGFDDAFVLYLGVNLL